MFPEQTAEQSDLVGSGLPACGQPKTESDAVLGELMGKDAAPRFKFIMEHAADTDAAALDL